jgi:type IX secretion system substrate protein/NHL repeat-containing protein
LFNHLINFMSSKHTSLFLFAFILCISQVKAQYITTFAGTGYGSGLGTGGYNGDGGLCFEAQLYNPTGVATYGYVTQYIADQGNHVIRKIDNRHIITTFAGSVTASSSCDGCDATTTKLTSPYGIAVDAYNNVYIADYGANVVRKVNTAGVIRTIAGNDTAGYSGDGGQAIHARLNHPYGVTVDAVGNIYISDAQNNVIRKVDGTGTITTYAGTGYGAGLAAGHGDYTGDGGPATGARLNFPAGITADKFGNLFIADASNSVIRKVNASGAISTYAGTGLAGYYGDGGAPGSARFSFPSGVAVDVLGNLFIADQGNNVIREVTTTGTISTIAGVPTPGFFGDGALAVNAQLNHPSGLAVDGNGLVYVADYGNNVIRLIGPASIVNAVKPVSNPAQDVKLYPNPSNGSFTVEIPQTSTKTTITVTDMMSRVIEAKIVDGLNATKIDLTLKNTPAGNYIIQITAGDFTYRDKLVIE